MSERAIDATVRGRVQGVGFRETARERAGGLGLHGWVLNADDGSVQVHAEGPEAALEAFAAWLHDGPPAAAVEDVTVEAAKVEGHEQFAIRGIPAGAFEVREADGGFVLELEVRGGPRSWRLPKAPVAARHLAIELDAPGASGTTWDRGTYEQRGRVAWPEALERGHAMVLFHGERLQGGYALQRTRPGQWLLIKRRD